MDLKTIILKNFRAYQHETRIEVGQLTAFIGKNDVGKSTILEALDIFFNDLKMDQDDACIDSDSDEVLIGCVFTNLPEEVVLDSNVDTTLKDEQLINGDGDLEIVKIYDCSLKTPKCATFAYANHPTVEPLDDLLQLKNPALKKLVRDLELDDSDVNKRENPGLRALIRANYPDAELAPTSIPLDDDNGKAIWNKLKSYLPVFALFQADRASRDDDVEVQDPMKAAVKEAIQEVEPELEAIREKVRERATEVAQRTIEKLADFDPDLAKELKPTFRSEPSWSGFKLSLTDHREISINKRGSGVRRMILLSFFRAAAERKRSEENTPSVIYAIEEPETSQHPDNQRLIVQSLLDLAEPDGCQILLTTHVPGLASMLPIEMLRFIDLDDDSQVRIRGGSEEVLAEIARTLGVFADKRVQVIICVEGTNDIIFLKRISCGLHKAYPEVPNLTDLEEDGQIAFIPLMGSLLKHWVNENCLRGLGIPEVHIYDRDDDNKYEEACAQVNARGDNSWATLTDKRMAESYLHPDAINQVFEINITFDDIEEANDDIPQLVADVIRSDKSNPWRSKIRPNQPSNPREWRGPTKKYLNNDVAALMTVEMLEETDAEHFIYSCLEKIASYL